MATSLGVQAITLPLPTFVGLLAFGVVYLVISDFDISTATGLGLIVLIAWRQAAPTFWFLYSALLFVSIGAKKAFDRPRRKALLGLGLGKST